MNFKRIFLATFFLATLASCSDSDSLAKVGNMTVSQAEFDAYLAFKNIPHGDKKRTDRALEEYLRRAALATAIEESGKLDNNLLQAELEEFRREMLISRYFDKHLRESVNDDSVRNYYVSNADVYKSKSAHAAHILFRVDTRMTESERQAQMTAAHEAYSLIKAGENFSTVAKSHSEDTLSAEKGGDLGWLREGAVAEKFSQKLFALEEGEITEPFLTPFGFHIVKLIEAPRTITRPLEAVSGDIRYQLRNQAKLAETQRLIESVNVSRTEK